MALAMHVSGPCQILMGASVLGYTEDGDLPSVDVTYHVRRGFSSDQGAEPAALIHRGVTAVISVLLTKWDLTILENTSHFIDTDSFCPT